MASERAAGVQAVRISSSKVAAICGLHPFCDADELLEMFEDAIYQDRVLCEMDAAALGVIRTSAMERVAMTVDTLSMSTEDTHRRIGRELAGILAQRMHTNTVESVSKLGGHAGSLVSEAVSCGYASSAWPSMRGNVMTHPRSHHPAGRSVSQQAPGCAPC